MDVWVHADGLGDAPSRVTLELLSAARTVAERVGVFGVAEHVRPLAGVFGRYGATLVVAVGGTSGGVTAGAVAAGVAPLVRSHPVDMVLFATSCEGRDVAGFLSALVDRTVIANGTGWTSAAALGGPLVETSMAGGTVTVRTVFAGPPPWLVSFRPASFERRESPAAAQPGIVGVDPPPGGWAVPVVLARHEEARSGPALEEAAVVVAGGRGVGSAEGFAQVEELARLLGGAPAATRAAVDAGWAPFAIQVGQTGRAVAPTVYLALGVSGAAQHVVGIRAAKHVIAVDKDHTAPIFALADLGVVGDVRDLLPRLLAAVRARLS
jgi:electron transfer flavoprotein alpha subunit